MATKFVRMADGRMVPASVSGNSILTGVDKKFLLVLQYWEGDKATMEDLASLIADLERVKNTSVDILVFARYDATNFPPALISKLQSKFGKVMQARCRRRASGYPYGANSMFYDLVTLLAQYEPYKNEYYAFLNLESDCTPTQSGWIGQIIRAWKEAMECGKCCIGHIQDKNPVLHLNGVAVYPIDLWYRVGASKLNGGPPNVAYDIHHGKDIVPLAMDSTLIRLDYLRPTITAKELFESGAVLYHGVKDGSARAAVRAKYIAMGGKEDLSQETVFTYFDPRGENPSEQQTVLALWDQAWRSRGWNPVVLKKRDAVRNPLYPAFVEAVNALPTLKDKRTMFDRWIRWLALDSVGGGLLAEYDVVPSEFTPQPFTNSSCLGAGASLCYVKGDALKLMLKTITEYKAQPDETINGKIHVDEAKVIPSLMDHKEDWVHPFGESNKEIPKLLHFSRAAIDSSFARGQAKSMVIRRYLQGEI